MFMDLAIALGLGLLVGLQKGRAESRLVGFRMTRELNGGLDIVKLFEVGKR